MSHAEIPRRLHQKLVSGLSRLAAGFWEKPALISIRVIAVIFVALAIVGLVLDSLSIQSRFSMDPFGALIFVLLAWVLSSKKVSQIIVGMFLVLTFVLSIVLLILPVEVLADSISQFMQAQLARQERLEPVSAKLSYAQQSLSYLVNSYPDVAKDFNFESANRGLKEAIELLPGRDPDASGSLVQTLTQTVSDLLKKSAPFIFAMLMGLMGSAIAVSRQFVSNFEGKPAVWYLYRLLQGMIIALLIVYGLVAGMLSLGVNTGNQPIDIAKFDTNKYFIGFVSALAGLFSEHAFARLESVSANVFGKNGNRGAEQEQAGGAGITTPRK